jgi:hypothetical protein
VSFILVPEFLKMRIGQDDFVRRLLLVMAVVPVAVDAALIALFVSAVNEVL